MKVKQMTMKSKPDTICKAFSQAFGENKPVNLKTNIGFHYAIGDLYFKQEGEKIFSYQLDKKMWVEIL